MERALGVGLGGVGWGGDVSIRCEVDMEVEATPYDAVKLSWKLMLRENTSRSMQTHVLGF